MFPVKLGQSNQERANLCWTGPRGLMAQQTRSLNAGRLVGNPPCGFARRVAKAEKKEKGSSAGAKRGSAARGRPPIPARLNRSEEDDAVRRRLRRLLQPTNRHRAAASERRGRIRGRIRGVVYRSGPRRCRILRRCLPVYCFKCC